MWKDLKWLIVLFIDGADGGVIIGSVAGCKGEIWTLDRGIWAVAIIMTVIALIATSMLHRSIQKHKLDHFGPDDNEDPLSQHTGNGMYFEPKH